MQISQGVRKHISIYGTHKVSDETKVKLSEAAKKQWKEHRTWYYKEV